MSDISLYDRYDKFIEPNVLGGINRAAVAERDQQGRFMPASPDNWRLDPNHGRNGGKARAAKTKRDERGRFA